MNHFEGLEIYFPGDDDTTEQMVECLSAYVPCVGAPDGIPDIDANRVVPCNNGCCFMVQSHDGVNNTVHQFGPFPAEAVTNEEERHALYAMVAKTISAPFN